MRAAIEVNPAISAVFLERTAASSIRGIAINNGGRYWGCAILGGNPLNLPSKGGNHSVTSEHTIVTMGIHEGHSTSGNIACIILKNSLRQSTVITVTSTS